MPRRVWTVHRCCGRRDSTCRRRIWLRAVGRPASQRFAWRCHASDAGHRGRQRSEGRVRASASAARSVGKRPTEQETQGETMTKETPTPTKPTPCPEPTEPRGNPAPPAERGGGGGGGIIQLPSFKQPNLPPMQLPDELKPVEPGSPEVLDVGAGAVAAAPVRPAEPITMPVIVAPPLGLRRRRRRRRRITGDAAGTTTWRAAPSVQSRSPDVSRRPRTWAAMPRCPLRLPDRVHRISAIRGTAAGRGLGSARSCGHSRTHRRRRIVGYRQAKAGHAGRAGTARFTM
jgi:hypothetical protein